MSFAASVRPLLGVKLQVAGAPHCVKDVIGRLVRDNGVLPLTIIDLGDNHQTGERHYKIDYQDNHGTNRYIHLAVSASGVHETEGVSLPQRDLRNDIPQAAQAGGHSNRGASKQADDSHQAQRGNELARRAAREIVAALDAATARLKDEEKPRSYLGASVIGNECDAFLAFNLRGFPNTQPDGRRQRIFRDGHRIEDQVVADLRAAGYKVEPVDPATGEQWEGTQFGGHVVAHLDGLIYGSTEKTPLEVKSMNKAFFQAFVKRGVAVSHPHYYDQVQLGLHLFDCRRALFIAYCKDDSRYEAELVERDDKRITELLERSARVMLSPVKRIAKKSTDWRCRGCFKFDVCWGDTKPEPACANCIFAVPDISQPGKKWYCTKHKREADGVCSDYQVWEPEA